MRIVIVGAGPTGLTAAVELARQGIMPTVIERQDEASNLSRAVGILPRSLELLTPSGVTEQLLAEGIKLRSVQIYQGRRKAASLSTRGTRPRHDYLLALAQDRTEAILREALSRYGGTVNFGREMIGLKQEGHQVIAETTDGEEISCEYLIGADGTRSTTRQSLGIDFHGYELPETWSIADVDAEDWPHPESFVISSLSGGRVVVVAPLEATRYRVVSNTGDALEALPLRMNITTIRRTAQFHISIRQVFEYGKGRVFLAGDAAHCHSPVGGRGMNLGIADAAELVQRLVQGQLEGYTISRHKVGAETIALSERARRLMTSPRFLNRIFLTVALTTINWLPFLKRRIAKTLLDG